MAIRVSDIEIHNFMSIEYAKLNLSRKGLVLVQGSNRDDDAFESNGSGKSTACSEAPVWAFYGVTIRGLKADGVINRKVGKGTAVSVVLLDDNGDEYQVTRHRKHAQHGNHVLLFRNGANITGMSDAATTQMIEELLGMDYLTFTNSVMFGQGVTKMFASSTDAEQKKILEQMLQIEIFRRAQDKAKEHVSDLNETLVRLESELAKDKAVKAQWERQIEELQAKEAELGEKVQKRLEELCDELERHSHDLSHCPTSDELVSDLEYLEGLLDKAQEKVDSFRELSNTRTELMVEVGTNTFELNKLEVKYSKALRELDDLRTGRNVPRKCNTCGQALPVNDTSHMQQHIQDSIKEMDTQKGIILKDLADLRGLVEKVDKKLEGKKKAQDNVQAVRDSMGSVNTEIRNNEAQRKHLEGRVKSTEALIEEQQELLKTTYGPMIEDLLWKVSNICDCIEIHHKEVEDTKVLRDKYAFWVDAYGNQGIKSVLLDSVTPFLNQRCNEYLTKLAGNSIEVTFSTQQEVTSGKNKGQKKDKFGVEVDNKNGDENYEGNSGGEKRRVDIAVNMALQDLVLYRTAKKLDLIVYDECFEGLDGIGCERVIELLHEKARRCGTVLVITHNDNLKQLFSKSMTMVKSGGKTTVKEDAV